MEQTPNQNSSNQALSKGLALASKGKTALGRSFRRLHLSAQPAHVARTLMQPIHFLAVVAILGVAAVVQTVYVSAYAVTVDGVPVGTVLTAEEFDSAVANTEARVSEILGCSYILDNAITYQDALVEKGFVSSPEEYEEFLFNTVTEITQNYVLYVDDELIGVSAEEGVLEAMLDEIQAPYITEDTLTVSFVEDVEIVYEYTPLGLNDDLDQMYAYLTFNTTGQTTYEVQSGDTFMALAYDNDMSLEDLMTLNPDVDIDMLQIGQIINIKQVIPYLSICTTATVSYEEVVSSPVEEVPDDSMYQGESRTLDEGTTGLAWVTSDLTYINGILAEQTVAASETLVAPTTKVIAVGTVERPSWYPNGYYIWPTYGTITSYFGYRTIFGSYSFHSGLDIASSYGTTIMAADGGTVTFAGTGTGGNWSYGNYIIIDHGNGNETLYAHCSSLLVSVGDTVYQGQSIALMGSTGRSTGNHLHFEIRLNGTAVNPLSYLP